MVRKMMMKKYKIRLTGLGIEAVAVIPFDDEPGIEQIENNLAYYLNNNLMKVEANDFYATDRYCITYEEISIEV
tara:strand:- start:3421 stop:3642 length:222 start_codon:yes stop_codon:yes gene_type:complete